jgi:hypothetical protein
MASPGWNPHKKGEHVFNDIAGSLENAFTSALKTPRANSLILINRFGPLNLPQTALGLLNFNQDRILAQARTVVAPATGLANDLNSRTYGNARLKLGRVLSDVVINTAGLIWKQKPRSNSSFHEFESVVASLRDKSLLRSEANSALDELINSAYDPQAEASALAERVSDTELARRRAAIVAGKQHLSMLKQAGHSLIRSFFEELEQVLEKRLA